MFMFMWLWLIDDLWLLLRSIEKPNTNELLVRDPYHPCFFRIVVVGVSVARGHTDPPRYYRHLLSALPQHLSVVCATENPSVCRFACCVLGCIHLLGHSPLFRQCAVSLLASNHLATLSLSVRRTCASHA